MKLSKRKLELIEKIGVLGGIFLIVFVIGYYTGYFRNNCGQDKACFNEHFAKCRAAEYISARQNNVYSYNSYPWGRGGKKKKKKQQKKKKMWRHAADETTHTNR